MKEIISILIFILSIFSIAKSTFAIENTIDPNFYEVAMKLEGNFLKGIDQNGDTCHILVKELIQGNLNRPYGVFPHKVINLIVTSEALPNELLDANSEEDFYAIMKSNFGEYYQHETSFKKASAGWCSNCGSAQRDGRLKGLKNKHLAFFAKGFTPAHDNARVYLSRDGLSVKKVEMYQYKNYYIPVINYSPKKGTYTCSLE